MWYWLINLKLYKIIYHYNSMTRKRNILSRKFRKKCASTLLMKFTSSCNVHRCCQCKIRRWDSSTIFQFSWRFEEWIFFRKFRIDDKLSQISKDLHYFITWKLLRENTNKLVDHCESVIQIIFNLVNV